MELVLPSVVPGELAGVSSALQALPQSSQDVWLEILPALGRRSDEQVFAFTLDRTLDALDKMRLELQS